MNKIAIIYILLLPMQNGWAQDAKALEKIENARIALITERLDLTPKEAEKFWPLYREYSSQRESLRKEYMTARGEFKRNEMTEEESKKLLNTGLRLKEQELELDRKYTDRLSTVITNRQLLALRKAEDDFRKMLLQRLRDRRDQQDRLNNRRQRSNDNY